MIQYYINENKDINKQLNFVSLQLSLQIQSNLCYDGFGRLIGSFFDSLINKNIQTYIYGLNYTYGSCRIKISQHNQYYFQSIKLQFCQQQHNLVIPFYGDILENKNQSIWINTENILVKVNKIVYHNQIYKLFQAQSITTYLYPSRSTQEGLLLNFKQQYLLAACAARDIVIRFRQSKMTWQQYNFYVNIIDSRLSLIIIELIRIWIDEEKMQWTQISQLLKQKVTLTKHDNFFQVYPITMIQKILPRHLQIIYQINEFWLKTIFKQIPLQNLQYFSIINLRTNQIFMGKLSMILCKAIIVPTEMHYLKLISERQINPIYQIFPEKFTTILYGSSHRIWMNQYIKEYISSYIGQDWLVDINLKQNLKKWDKIGVDVKRWKLIKQNNKKKLIDYIQRKKNISLNSQWFLDVHFKPITKIQNHFLSLFYCLDRYVKIKNNQFHDFIPRILIYSGKVYQNDHLAFRILKYILKVSHLINSNQIVNKYFKIILLQNYSLQLQHLLFEASQLSHHLSSSSFNQYNTDRFIYLMNGGLLLGTNDPLNIEIESQLGKQNIYLFGCDEKKEKFIIQKNNYNNNLGKQMKLVIDEFSKYEWGIELLNDFNNCFQKYLIFEHFDQYIKINKHIQIQYCNKEQWFTNSLKNMKKSVKYFSDISLQNHLQQIWN